MTKKRKHLWTLMAGIGLGSVVLASNLTLIGNSGEQNTIKNNSNISNITNETNVRAASAFDANKIASRAASNKFISPTAPNYKILNNNYNLISTNAVPNNDGSSGTTNVNPSAYFDHPRSTAISPHGLLVYDHFGDQLVLMDHELKTVIWKQTSIRSDLYQARLFEMRYNESTDSFILLFLFNQNSKWIPYVKTIDSAGNFHNGTYLGESDCTDWTWDQINSLTIQPINGSNNEYMVYSRRSAPIYQANDKNFVCTKVAIDGSKNAIVTDYNLRPTVSSDTDEYIMLSRNDYYFSTDNKYVSTFVRWRIKSTNNPSLVGKIDIQTWVNNELVSTIPIDTQASLGVTFGSDFFNPIDKRWSSIIADTQVEYNSGSKILKQTFVLNLAADYTKDTYPFRIDVSYTAQPGNSTFLVKSGDPIIQKLYDWEGSKVDIMGGIFELGAWYLYSTFFTQSKIGTKRGSYIIMINGSQQKDINRIIYDCFNDNDWSNNGGITKTNLSRDVGNNSYVNFMPNWSARKGDQNWIYYYSGSTDSGYGTHGIGVNQLYITSHEKSLTAYNTAVSNECASISGVSNALAKDFDVKSLSADTIKGAFNTVATGYKDGYTISNWEKAPTTEEECIDGKLNINVTINNGAFVNGLLATSKTFTLHLSGFKSSLDWLSPSVNINPCENIQMQNFNSLTIENIKNFILNNYGLFFDYFDPSWTFSGGTLTKDAVNKSVKVSGLVVNANGKQYNLSELTITGFIFANLSFTPKAQPTGGYNDKYASEVKDELIQGIHNEEKLVNVLSNFYDMGSFDKSSYKIDINPNKIIVDNATGSLNIEFKVLYTGPGASNNVYLPINSGFTLNKKGLTSLKNNSATSTETLDNIVNTVLKTGLNDFVKKANIVQNALDNTSYSAKNIQKESNYVTCDLYVSNNYVDLTTIVTSGNEKLLGKITVYGKDSAQDVQYPTIVVKNGDWASSPLFSGVNNATAFKEKVDANRNSPDLINALLTIQNKPANFQGTVTSATVSGNNVEVTFQLSNVWNADGQFETKNVTFTYELLPTSDLSTKINKMISISGIEQKYAFQYLADELNKVPGIVQNPVENSTITITNLRPNNRNGTIKADVEVSNSKDSLGHITNNPISMQDVVFCDAKKLTWYSTFQRNETEITETNTEIDKHLSDLSWQKAFIQKYFNFVPNDVGSQFEIVSNSFKHAPAESRFSNLGKYEAKVVFKNYFKNDATFTYDSNVQPNDKATRIVFFSQVTPFTNVIESVKVNGIAATDPINGYIVNDFVNSPENQEKLKQWIINNFKSIFEGYTVENPTISDIQSLSCNAIPNEDTSLNVSVTLAKANTENGIQPAPFTFKITGLANRQLPTTIKDQIDVSNLTTLPATVSANTYAIDITKWSQKGDLQQAILNDINQHPENYLNNPPTTAEELGTPARNIIDPNTTPTFSLLEDGTSIQINLKYLARRESSKLSAEYTPGTIIIKGFNSTATELSPTAATTGISVSSDNALSSKLANEAGDTELQNFLKSHLSDIYVNISKTFTETNQNIGPNGLSIVSKLASPDEGKLTLEITANDAKLSSGGYGKTEKQTIVLTGFVRSQQPTNIKPTVTISGLSIPTITSDTYAIDLTDSRSPKKAEFINTIVDHINNNPGKYLDNAPDSEVEINGRPFVDSASTPTFTLGTDGTSVQVKLRYLAAGENPNKPAEYKDGLIAITGFNAKPTELSSSANSISITGALQNKMPTQVVDVELQSFLTNSTNLKNIFVNYSETFLSVNGTYSSSGLTIASRHNDDVDGSITLNISVNAAKLNTGGTNGYGPLANLSVKIIGFTKPGQLTKGKTLTATETSIAGLDQKYSLDIIDDVGGIKNIIQTSINNVENLSTWFINPPAVEKIQSSSLPIINPESPLNWEYTSNSITVRGQFLSTQTNPNDPLVYSPMDIMITNLKDTATICQPTFNITQANNDTNNIKNKFADSITTTDLEPIFKDQSMLSTIFSNYPNKFLTSNVTSLAVTQVRNPSKVDGSLDADIKVQFAKVDSANAAGVESSTFQNGYATKTFTIKIEGFQKPQAITEIKEQTIDVSTLKISGLDNTKYSTDLVNNQSLQSLLENDINSHPEKYFNNQPTLSSGEKYVSGLGFALAPNPKNAVNVTFTYTSKNENPNNPNTQVNGTITLTGFNANVTDLNSDGRLPHLVNGLTNYLPSAIKNPNDKAVIETLIKEDIKNNGSKWFDNTPEAFLNEIKTGNIEIVSGTAKDNDKAGTLNITIKIQNAWVGSDYGPISKEITIKGFDNSTELTKPKPIVQAISISDFANANGSTYEQLKGLNNKFIKDVQTNMEAPNSQMKEQLKAIINASPEIFFTGISSDDTTNPILKAGTDIILSYNEDTGVMTVTGQFRQDKLLPTETAPKYQSQTISISGFNRGTTTVNSSILDISSLLNKSECSPAKAVEILNAKKSELTAILKDNVNAIFPNAPEGLANALQSGASINIVPDANSNSVKIIVSNIPTATNGKINVNGSLEIVINGFNPSTLNSQFRCNSIDAGTILFSNIFGSDCSQFGLDWKNGKQILNSTQAFDVNGKILTYMNNHSSDFINVPFSAVSRPITNVVATASATEEIWNVVVTYTGYKEGNKDTNLTANLTINLKSTPSINIDNQLQDKINEITDPNATLTPENIKNFIDEIIKNDPSFKIPNIPNSLVGDNGEPTITIDSSKIHISKDNNNSDPNKVSQIINIDKDAIQIGISPNIIGNESITIRFEKDNPITPNINETNSSIWNWLPWVIVGSVILLLLLLLILIMMYARRRKYRNSDIAGFDVDIF